MTHRVAADLIDCGVIHTQIHERIFDVFTPSRSKLFGYCLYEKLEIIPELRTALIYLSAEEIQRFNVITGDTEGLVNLGLNIENIVLSVLIIDRTKMVKMSFRSKGDFAVNEYAEKYFSGGGHRNASGGQSPEPLENVVQKFRDTIKLYEKELNAV
jgi:phosphoesterase RecJ-like protein